MKTWIFVACVLTGLRSAAAVFTDEAYVVDWHKEQIGLLRPDTTLWSPAASLIAAVTDKNVLAVLNGTNGDIKWRTQLEVPVTAVAHAPGHVVTVSDRGDDQSGIAAWNLQDALQSWDLTLNGRARMVVASRDGESVLTGSPGKLRSLDASTGSQLWDIGINGTPLRGLALDQGYGLVIEEENGAVSLVTVDDTGREISRKELTKAKASVAVLNDHWVALQQDSAIKVFRLLSGTPKNAADVKASGSVVIETAAEDAMVFQVDGRRVSVLANGKTSESDVASGPAILSSTPSGDDCDLVQHASGSLEMICGSSTKWTRHEDLAYQADAAFVEIEDAVGSLSAEELLYEETADVFSAFVRRTQRHVAAGISYVQSLRSGGSAAAALLERLIGHDATKDQMFGFNRYLVVSTELHTVYALSSHQGTVAWRLENVGPAGPGSRIVATNTNVYVIGKDGLFVVLDGRTGRQLATGTANSPVRSVHTVNDTVLLWTEDNTLVPAGESTNPLSDAYLTSVDDDESCVHGYAVKDGQLHKTWRWTAPGSSKIVATASRDPHDLSASIGRPLGDRSVLYKYLHHNALAIATIDSDGTLTVALLDAVSGRVLHTKQHADKASNVQLVFGEHWIVYSFYSQLPTPGQKIVTWDLYESEYSNVRFFEGVYSSLSDFRPPHVASQAFMYHMGITALGVTRTRFGITSRDVLAALDSGQLVRIPKSTLDARRPTGRKPTAHEQQEGLQTYEGYIQVIPHNVVSHLRHVLGLRHIVSSPADLESTSHIGAFGDLDIFYTRVTPSLPFDVLPASFEKGKLLATAAGLVVLLTQLRRAVLNRQLSLRWK